MIYELRIYECFPGRLPSLLERFEDVTLDLWKKHGIEQVGFWTPTVGRSNKELIYILKWESLADREQKWNAFTADPIWLDKRAASEADGPIVATILVRRVRSTLFITSTNTQKYYPAVGCFSYF